MVIKTTEKVRGVHGFQETYAEELDHRTPIQEVQALYPVWMEGLKVWLLFAPILIIMLAVIYAEYGYSRWWIMTGYFVMPFLSTLIRRKTSNLFLFIISSLVMALWVLLMPGLLLKILGGGFALLLMAYGIVRKNSRIERPLTLTYLIFVLVFITVTDLVMLSKDFTEYQAAVLLEGLVYTGSFLFLQHRIALIDSLTTIDKRSNRSIKQMTRFNSVLYLGFFVLISLAFLGLYEIRLGNLLSLLANYVLLGGRRLVRMIFSIEATEKAMMQEQDLIRRTNADIVDFLGGHTAAFWVIAQRILVIVVIIGAIVLAVYLMVHIYQRFGHKVVYHEKDLEVSREFYTSRTGRQKRRGRIQEPEEPVRKRYYYLVKKEMGETVLPSDTPTDVAGKVPAVSEILSEYETVRYGE